MREPEPDDRSAWPGGVVVPLDLKLVGALLMLVGVANVTALFGIGAFLGTRTPGSTDVWIVLRTCAYGGVWIWVGYQFATASRRSLGWVTGLAALHFALFMTDAADAGAATRGTQLLALALVYGALVGYCVIRTPAVERFHEERAKRRRLRARRRAGTLAT